MPLARARRRRSGVSPPRRRYRKERGCGSSPNHARRRNVPLELELALAATPAEDDAVVEEEGARVFLEPRAAELLDDKRLEADVETGRVTFAIAQQAA